MKLVGTALPGVFLTGGSALGPFYLGHRRSADLDLFTRDSSAYDERTKQFARLMEGEGFSVVAGSAGPGFRRFIVSDGAEAMPVDLVLDTAERIAPPTVSSEGLEVDSLEDIAANKLGAIVGRAEVRDYVDLYFLAQAGRDPVTFVAAAQRKDRGVDAATLAFVLSEVKVRRAPEGLVRTVSATELQEFIDDLRRRLARAAFPEQP